MSESIAAVRSWENVSMPRLRIFAGKHAGLLVYLIASALVAVAAPLGAAEINVMISGGFSEAFKELVPKFEEKTGHKILTQRGPSMGETPQAIPNRLARGEPADVLIMVGEALDDLAARGRVVRGSRVDLARSLIGGAVRVGTPKPDIGTVDAFTNALRSAPSIAYSDSASGVYLEKVLFPRLGIWEEIKHKSRMIPADPVGTVVARGDAALGFQQISELKAVPGIELLGPIPQALQKVTLFSAGIAAAAQRPAEARALIEFLASPQSAGTIEHTGLEPVHSR